MRERRETLPRRERPLLAGKKLPFSGGCVLQLFNVFSQYLTKAAFVFLAAFVFHLAMNYLAILLK